MNCLQRGVDVLRENIFPGAKVVKTIHLTLETKNLVNVKIPGGPSPAFRRPFHLPMNHSLGLVKLR